MQGWRKPNQRGRSNKEGETALRSPDEVFTIWKAVHGCAANINKDSIQGLGRTGKGLGITIKAKKDAEKFVLALKTYLTSLGFFGGSTEDLAEGPRALDLRTELLD